jgi:hypothetical protein
MINKYALLLILSISVFACNADQNTHTAPAVSQQKTDAPVKKIHFRQPDSFHHSLAASVLPGAAIGSIDGFLWNTCDRMLIGKKYCWLLWPFEWLIRIEIESEVIQLLNRHDIKHSPQLLHTSAWITSWLSYLLAWKFVRM